MCIHDAESRYGHTLVWLFPFVHTPPDFKILVHPAPFLLEIFPLLQDFISGTGVRPCGCVGTQQRDRSSTTYALVYIIFTGKKDFKFSGCTILTQHALRRIGIVSTLASLMIVLATLLTVVLGYDNGVARTPPMGWNCKS